MKIISIFGTRPEMIKMWGTLKLLDAQNFEHIMVHTGQNYKKELKEFFFHKRNFHKTYLVCLFLNIFFGFILHGNLFIASFLTKKLYYRNSFLKF